MFMSPYWSPSPGRVGENSEFRILNRVSPSRQNGPGEWAAFRIPNSEFPEGAGGNSEFRIPNSEFLKRRFVVTTNTVIELPFRATCQGRVGENSEFRIPNSEFEISPRRGVRHA